MRFSAIACATAFLLTTLPLTGRSQTCGVSIPATIVDATSGKFIPSVQPGMLHAKIKKSFITASAVERIRTFRVLLLVDASGSMSEIVGSQSNQRAIVQKLKEMLDENLNSFPPGVQVSFGMFNTQIAFANEFTSDPERLHRLVPETIARLKSESDGDTPLFDAIHMAVAQFGSVQPGDTILLLTDGGENSSRQTSKRSVANELSSKGVRLFVLLVENPSPSQPEEVAAVPNMSEFAERSGGAVRVYPPTSYRWWGEKKYLLAAKDDLKRFWNEEVLAAYLVHFNLPRGIRNEEKWLLAIDPAANRGKPMAAGYPSRLEPCPLITAATAH